MGGVEAVRDAEAVSVGQDAFEGRSRVSVVALHVDGEEGNRRGGLVRQGIALPEASSPGVEGGDGEVIYRRQDSWSLVQNKRHPLGLNPVFALSR